MEQAVDVTYYLAGPSGSSGLSAFKYYTQERGSAIYDDVRSVNWNGKVGLMYPSDYAYTFGHGVDETCYSDTYNCETGTPSSSWLFNSKYQRTITPSSGHSYLISRIQTGGGHVLLEAYLSPTIRPVVYLKDSVMLSGTGTSTDPYEIVSNFY